MLVLIKEIKEKIRKEIRKNTPIKKVEDIGQIIFLKASNYSLCSNLLVKPNKRIFVD